MTFFTESHSHNFFLCLLHNRYGWEVEPLTRYDDKDKKLFHHPKPRHEITLVGEKIQADKVTERPKYIGGKYNNSSITIVLLYFTCVSFIKIPFECIMVALHMLALSLTFHASLFLQFHSNSDDLLPATSNA